MAVAEERHFRRAAERLGMTQPPLSILIQVLEQEIGTLLLRRTRRSVELTEAGALFLAEARDVLERAQRAIKLARDVEQGNAGGWKLASPTRAPSTRSCVGCFAPSGSATPKSISSSPN